MLAAAALAAFGLGLALIGFGAGRVAGASTGKARALKRAAAANDARPFRAALGEAMRAHPELAALWRADPAIARDLEALDARLFGQDPTVSTPPSGISPAWPRR